VKKNGPSPCSPNDKRRRRNREWSESGTREGEVQCKRTKTEGECGGWEQHPYIRGKEFRKEGLLNQGGRGSFGGTEPNMIPRGEKTSPAPSLQEGGGGKRLQ